MPILSGQFGRRGPIVQVHIGVSSAQQAWMQRNGQVAPPMIAADLLLDTGADTTTIDESIMRALAIAPTSTAPVQTITTNGTSELCPVYPASMEIRATVFGDRPHSIKTMEVLGRSFDNTGIQGVLGRDVLCTLLFMMEGPVKRFTIQWA